MSFQKTRDAIARGELPGKGPTMQLIKRLEVLKEQAEDAASRAIAGRFQERARCRELVLDFARQYPVDVFPPLDPLDAATLKTPGHSTSMDRISAHAIRHACSILVRRINEGSTDGQDAEGQGEDVGAGGSASVP